MVYSVDRLKTTVPDGVSKAKHGGLVRCVSNRYRLAVVVSAVMVGLLAVVLLAVMVSKLELLAVTDSISKFTRRGASANSFAVTS